MKNVIISIFILFVSVLSTNCTKESLKTNEIIKKHKFSYFIYFDSESTPFKKNASLYANVETDSCLLILKNKEGDTILSHLDKSIINIVSIKYSRFNDNWFITKRDYGKTIYTDSTGEKRPDFYSKDRYTLDKIYKINENKRNLEKIKIANNKYFIKKLISKYNFLNNIQIAELQNNSTYVFKDTTESCQVLYQFETAYNLKYEKGQYSLEPSFKNINKIGIYKNRIIIENDRDLIDFGEKVYFGKNDWDFNFRYKIESKKYYKFNGSASINNNYPSHKLFKTEIIVYDWKHNVYKLIKDFPKDSLFEYYNFIVEKQKNKNIYVGIYPEQLKFYYLIDTVNWELKKLKEIKYKK
jgi:hypothetical protein